MSDEQCDHSWGGTEEVETSGGIVHSPLCRHCGAVKLEVGRQRAERQRQAWIDREVVAPLTAADKTLVEAPGRAIEAKRSPLTQQGVDTPDKPKGWPVGSVANPRLDPVGHRIQHPVPQLIHFPSQGRLAL